MKQSSLNELTKEAPSLNLSQTFKDRTDSMIKKMRELKRKSKSESSTEQDTKNKV